MPAAARALIVKLSSLGDVVHAMPAVQDMVQARPAMQIDWVVEPAFAPLVARCQGVRRVIPCNLRQWSKQPFAAATRAAWRRFRADLQLDAYDAVLDLQGLSKSALVAWLARTTAQGQRYALANRTDGSGYEAPTRWVADRAINMPAHVHAVERSRLLCAQALGYPLHGAPRFGLRGLDSDLVQTSQPHPVVVLVHGTSRADKEWPLEHWVALGQRLNAAGWTVALAHGNAAEQATSERIAAALQDARVWPLMPLDHLTDAMAACAGVIGVDSGLSHIAVALDLPHVQLYNFDTAWRTGVDNPKQTCVYGQPVPAPDAVWQAWLGVSDSGLQAVSA
jgi:heptosyltransferase I